MKSTLFLLSLFGMVLLVPNNTLAAVSITNHWQKVLVKAMGDGDILDEQTDNSNGGGDADLYVEAFYLGYVFGSSSLKTAYTADGLTVDGKMRLDASQTIDYDELSIQGDIYYYSTITVTDAPVWVTVKGYLTTDRDHEANDHFWVAAPLWYWDVEYSSGDKVWMVDTGLFDIGTHNIYGGINYTLAVATGEPEKSLYADYYFVIETSPVFDPSRADLNNDGAVNLADLSLFASAWLWQQ